MKSAQSKPVRFRSSTRDAVDAGEFALADAEARRNAALGFLSGCASRELPAHSVVTPALSYLRIDRWYTLALKENDVDEQSYDYLSVSFGVVGSQWSHERR